ncbi:hypothetical protein IF2G_05422 [Cordyceps javanica]|nr:hypothetical protein IF2G_05422 [Cordyceps javanica]
MKQLLKPTDAAHRSAEERRRNKHNSEKDRKRQHGTFILRPTMAAWCSQTRRRSFTANKSYESQTARRCRSLAIISLSLSPNTCMRPVAQIKWKDHLTTYRPCFGPTTPPDVRHIGTHAAPHRVALQSLTLARWCLFFFFFLTTISLDTFCCLVHCIYSLDKFTAERQPGAPKPAYFSTLVVRLPQSLPPTYTAYRGHASARRSLKLLYSLL